MVIMENQKFVDSIIQEIVQPGVDELLNNRFFTELRRGKLSQKRLKGFALQHYHCNHAINKGLAFCMVRNANNPPLYNQFQELFTVECVAHTAAVIRGMFLGTQAESRAGALVNETMVCRYSGEFDTYLEKHYGFDSRARTFFIVHSKVDQEHTVMASESIARNANTDRDKEMVRAAARNMVRFKLAKFEGIYDAYA